MHFTPTSSSWLNTLERFFRDLTDKRLRRGRDVGELITAIGDSIDQHNQAPKPFIWAKATDILERSNAPVRRIISIPHDALH
jgi:hypothetical protein